MTRRHWLMLLGLLLTLVPACRSADTQPPWVSISSPQTGASVSNMTFVSVTATDNVGVASVSLKVDGADIRAPLTNPPFAFSLNTWTVANGMHSLMAVATDAAGNFASSPVVSISVANPSTNTLAQGPFTVENLGGTLSGATLWQQWMVRLPSSGGLHLLTYYSVASFDEPVQIFDADLTHSTARLVNSVLGRPGVYCTALHPNGKVYMSAGSPGVLFEYDPVTGGTNFIGTFSSNEARSPQDMEVGDDGWVYISQYDYYGGAVSRYNPSTHVLQDLGDVNSSIQPGPFYAYTVGADSRYMYVSFGEDPFYLGVWDTTTDPTNMVFYWPTNNDTLGLVCHGKAGGWYYERKQSDGTLSWYVLTNGVPVQTADTPSVYNVYGEKPNAAVGSAYFPLDFNTTVKSDYAYPFSGANQATVQWQTVGVTSWQSLTVSNLFIEPISIQRLYSYSNNLLFGFGAAYGPVFTYTLGSGNASLLGVSTFSLYDAVFSGTQFYLSGYPTALLAYDYSQPWTLVASTTNKMASGVNPQQTGLQSGKHYYYSCFGSDGQVYVAIQHERTDNGGELGWYDPVTKTNGSIRNVFNHNWNPEDLKPFCGGTKIIYSENSGNLYVLDVATKTIVQTNAPLGTVPMDKIIETSPGILFGATTNLIFLASATNDTVFYTNTLPGTAFSQGGAILQSGERLVLGPDGYVWMFVNNSLYRIDPSVGSMTKILDRTASSLMFVGGDLYFYGGPSGTASAANLYRIKGVLVLDRPQPASDLRVLGP